MKIVTNVDRQMFGGISISNINLFLSLEKSGHTFVGLEIPRGRSLPGATAFWRFSPSFFKHEIIQVPDIWEILQLKQANSVQDLKKMWKPAIDLVVQLLEKEKPDVVLLNGTYVVPWILAEAADKLKIPMVLRYAGVLTIETQTVRDEHVREVYRTLEKTFVPRVQHCIFPSTVAKRVVEEVVTGHEIKNATILPNPVYVPKTYRNHSNKIPTLAAVGRWARVKNLPAYFSLHRRLLRDGFKHRSLLITNHESSSRVPGTIEEVAPMSHEQLWQFYTHLNLLVVPSTFETFCNVAAEAVVTGTPVLVSKTVGFSEVLEKFGLHDMVIPSFEDTDLVAERVKKLVKKRISFWTRRKLRNYLEPNAVHKQIVDVLQNVIKK